MMPMVADLKFWAPGGPNGSELIQEISGIRDPILPQVDQGYRHPKTRAYYKVDRIDYTYENIGIDCKYGARVTISIFLRKGP